MANQNPLELLWVVASAGDSASPGSDLGDRAADVSNLRRVAEAASGARSFPSALTARTPGSSRPGAGRRRARVRAPRARRALAPARAALRRRRSDSARPPPPADSVRRRSAAPRRNGPTPPPGAGSCSSIRLHHPHPAAHALGERRAHRPPRPPRRAQRRLPGARRLDPEHADLLGQLGGPAPLGVGLLPLRALGRPGCRQRRRAARLAAVALRRPPRQGPRGVSQARPGPRQTPRHGPAVRWPAQGR